MRSALSILARSSLPVGFFGFVIHGSNQMTLPDGVTSLNAACPYQVSVAPDVVIAGTSGAVASEPEGVVVICTGASGAAGAAGAGDEAGGGAAGGGALAAGPPQATTNAKSDGAMQWKARVERFMAVPSNAARS